VETGYALVRDLALVLGVGAVTSVVFRRLHQPVVLGYLLTGLVLGPHVPLPLLADVDRIRTLAELGVILVMFSVGLDLSLRRLAGVLPTAGLTALVQLSLSMWLGFTVARAAGWTPQESLFAGAIVAISSTMVVARVFAENRIRGRLPELVFGVLIVQDLAAILLLAFLTTVATGRGLPAGALLVTAGRLGAFLVAMAALGFLVVPRTIRAVAALRSGETLLVTVIGFAFAFALLAQELGYSVALGAFLAGSLVSESGETARVGALVRPVRDVFALVFFVAVGMLVDPAVILERTVEVAALTAIVLLAQPLGVAVGAFLSGHDARTSIQAGMSLAQIGEFSFILATVGITTGAAREFLLPVAVAVSVITTFTTPWYVRASERVALEIDRRLPRPLQTFSALYGSWLSDARRGDEEPTPRARRRRLARRLLVDAIAIAAIAIGASVEMERLVAWAGRWTGLEAPVARGLVLAGGFLLASPFAFGAIRTARALGAALAAAALPQTGTGRLDLAAAPRRALVVALQLGLVLLVGLPLLALTQPFLPPGVGAVVLGLVLAALGVAFWRSAENLQAHVRAAAEVIAEALAKQARAGTRPTLDDVHRLLPGFGDLTPVELDDGSPGIGRTLAELNLRGKTGASVLAIARGGRGLVAPAAAEVLDRGDVLALAGTREAVDAARELLAAGAPDVRDAGGGSRSEGPRPPSRTSPPRSP
jgi:CPA2 family monovalent cation:H+ antiporter-2